MLIYHVFDLAIEYYLQRSPANHPHNYWLQPKACDFLRSGLPLLNQQPKSSLPWNIWLDGDCHQSAGKSLCDRRWEERHLQWTYFQEYHVLRPVGFETLGKIGPIEISKQQKEDCWNNQICSKKSGSNIPWKPRRSRCWGERTRCTGMILVPAR